MKALRLTRAEAIAYTNGERRFWRVLKRTTEHRGPYNPAYVECHKNDLGWSQICPYGKPGDRIFVSVPGDRAYSHLITAIIVEQRNGRWGWVVEVGNG